MGKTFLYLFYKRSAVSLRKRKKWRKDLMSVLPEVKIVIPWRKENENMKMKKMKKKTRKWKRLMLDHKENDTEKGTPKEWKDKRQMKKN